MHMSALGAVPVIDQEKGLAAIASLMQELKNAKSRKDMDIAFDKMKATLGLNTPEYDALFQKTLKELGVAAKKSDDEGIRSKNVISMMMTFGPALQESQVISAEDSNTIQQMFMGANPKNLVAIIKEVFDFIANKKNLPQEAGASTSDQSKETDKSKEADNGLKIALIAGGGLLTIGTLVYLATRKKSRKK